MRLRIEFRIVYLKASPSLYRLRTGRLTHIQPVLAPIHCLTGNLSRRISSQLPRFILASPMASDEDYSNFLDKVNQDTSPSRASTQPKSKTVGTKSLNADIPKHLEGIEEYYISEADEPFEPVSLQWDDDGLPSEGTEA